MQQKQIGEHDLTEIKEQAKAGSEPGRPETVHRQEAFPQLPPQPPNTIAHVQYHQQPQGQQQSIQSSHNPKIPPQSKHETCRSI